MARSNVLLALFVDKKFVILWTCFLW